MSENVVKVARSRPRIDAPAMRNPWWIVIGCLLAATTTSGPVMTFSFSLFIQPLTDEFGWSRSTISLGYSAAVLMTAVFLPLTGRLLDRYGVRKVMLPVCMLYAAALAMLALTPANALVFVLLYGVAGIFGSGHSPVPYSKIVATWFDAHRGLALGISMAGIGIGAALMPQLASALIERFGWRLAYVGLGLTVLGIAVPVILLLIRERTDSTASVDAAAANGAPSMEGMSLREVLRDRRFWFIAVSVFLISMALNGVAAHAVPLLRLHGVTAADAARALLFLGIASLVGRLCTGLLLDRFFAPYIAAANVLAAFAAVALLWSGAGVELAMVLLGLSLGAEVDVIGYLVSRYFGLLRFGEILGYVIATFALSAALGAPFMGLSFDWNQSYDAALALFGAGLILSAALVLQLGPYRYAPRHG